MNEAEMGIYKEAANMWRDFVDAMHPDKNISYETEEQKTFMALWYQDTNDKTYQQWRWLVQIAFINGYEKGFTDRIFKGDLK
jgi:deoxyadenosine/deoxycytidine kinase